MDAVVFQNMDKDMLRDVIYKEIMEYHQPRTPTFSFNAVLRPAPKPEPSTLVLSPCPPIEEKQLDAQLKVIVILLSAESKMWLYNNIFSGSIIQQNLKPFFSFNSFSSIPQVKDNLCYCSLLQADIHLVLIRGF